MWKIGYAYETITNYELRWWKRVKSPLALNLKSRVNSEEAISWIKKIVNTAPSPSHSDKTQTLTGSSIYLKIERTWT